MKRFINESLLFIALMSLMVLMSTLGCGVR